MNGKNAGSFRGDNRPNKGGRYALVTRLMQTEKATLISQGGLYLCRQRPTLPHSFACRTIGPARLNLRRFVGVSESGDSSRNPERRRESIPNLENRET